MLSYRWKITLFGSLRLENDARVSITRFSAQKTGLLLAYLARSVNRPGLSRELLSDRLWPDASPDAGRHILRQAVASLRRQLEPPGTPRGSVLTLGAHQALALHPEAVEVDTALFEKTMREAVQRKGTQDERTMREPLLCCNPTTCLAVRHFFSGVRQK